MYPTITSIKNNKRYFWIKVPRTASISYTTLFSVYNDGLLKTRKNSLVTEGLHTHETYEVLRTQENLPGIAVVRNPRDRFYSLLAHLLHLQERCRNGICVYSHNHEECLQHKFSIPTDTEKDIHDFFTETFEKNFTNTQYTVDLFKTQVHFAYHPKVKIFHFEKLYEFNSWIEEELGYDISLLSHSNKHVPKFLSNIDKNHPLFVKTAEHLYNIDFKVFNYPLQYLT